MELAFFCRQDLQDLIPVILWLVEEDGKRRVLLLRQVSGITIDHGQRS